MLYYQSVETQVSCYKEVYLSFSLRTIVTYFCDPGYRVPLLCVCWESGLPCSPQTVICIAEKDNVTSVPGEMERDGVSNIQTFVCLQVQWMLVETVTVLAVH